MRTDQNSRVSLVEFRGLVSATVHGALQEMAAIASGTRTVHYFYHASVNPEPPEHLTGAQWEQAVDVLEQQLGLNGQPRFVVEHEKAGRVHRHVIWSRIDPDSLTAISDARNFQRHALAAREIERMLGHKAVTPILTRGEKQTRPARRPKDWEGFRGQESGRSPQSVAAEVTALWQAADSGTAFAAALAAHGYILARGDRRDYVLIDAAGDDHSLARRIAGAKAAEIRARLADLDQAALPSVAEARALARQQSSSGGGAPATPADAAAQVWAAAGQYRSKSPRRMPVRQAIPARDAAMAADQVQAAAELFASAIAQLGHVPQVVAELVTDGRHWWERMAEQATALAEEASDTLHSWRDYVLQGIRPVHDPRGTIDPGRGER